jgi:hypothetical protein
LLLLVIVQGPIRWTELACFIFAFAHDVTLLMDGPHD